MIKTKILMAILFTNIFFLNNELIKVLVIANNDYITSVYVEENYNLDYDKGIYILSNGVNYKQLEVSNGVLSEYNNQAYLFYNTEEGSFIQVFDISLKLIKTIKITDYYIDPIITVNNGIVIVYNYLDDIHLTYLYDNDKVYSKTFDGTLIEEVKSFIYYNDEYYMLVYRDNLTGGDFGYGGQGKTLSICKLNKSFEIVSLINLDLSLNNYYLSEACLKVGNSSIYLLVSDNNNHSNVFLFDLELNYLNKSIIEYDYFIIGNNDLIMVIYNNMINVYDYYLFNLKYSTEFNYDSFHEFTNFYYFTLGNSGYIIDLINLEGIRNANNSKNYQDDFDNVFGLTGKAMINSFNYLEYFDEEIFGLYNIEVEYVTSYNKSFIIDSDIYIPLKTNVSENMIYKTGYRLDFNAHAILDNISIVNNYPVSKNGKHTLTLKGVNTEDKVINFSVSNDQLSFQDPLKTKAIEYEVNEDIRMEYIIPSDVEIVDINTTDCIVKDYEVIGEKLIVTLNSYNTPGIKDLYINYIDYLVKDEEQEIRRRYYLYDHVIINILIPKPNITLIDYNNDFEFTFESIDDYNSIRALEIELSNNQNNYSLYYPIEKTKLIISDVPSGIYKCTFRLLVNRYKETYDDLEMFTLELNIAGVTDLGEVTINNKGATLNRFTLNLNKNQIRDNANYLKIDNKNIYTRDSSSPTVPKIIVISVILFAIGGIGSFFISRLIRKKSKRLKKITKKGD